MDEGAARKNIASGDTERGQSGWNGEARAVSANDRATDLVHRA